MTEQEETTGAWSRNPSTHVPLAKSCANCGKTGGDTVKLKNCTACLLVVYCGVDCQKAHRKHHKKACRKRAAELHDERLFKEVGHERGDCAICFLPMPLDRTEGQYMSCCAESICSGCFVETNARQNVRIGALSSCPFCREGPPHNAQEIIDRVQKHISRGHAHSYYFLADKYYNGTNGLPVNKARAVELWTEAARLGDMCAHFNLSTAYYIGSGIEKNYALYSHHLEQAAMGGHEMARRELGFDELQRGNSKRAVRHFVLAAKLGEDQSLEKLKAMYRSGRVSKEDFEAALRGHKKAVDECDSSSRRFARA